MRILIGSLLLLLASACGPHVGSQGSDVGAACTSASQCASQCLQGNDHFPGGMCTIACGSDVQCPKGSVCVDGGHSAGGICAVACAIPGDCSGFGRGFVCDAVDRVGVGGQALICRVP
ncbi:MAG: hypothetical protein ACXVAN_06800 [Polyangia bacterium]